MDPAHVTWGRTLSHPCHRSFFRARLAERARAAREGEDPVQEYLIDQANLRGYLGAFSGRDDLGPLDPSLSPEEIVVGLLQPHAPWEARVVKLVVRILQSGDLDLDRLVLLAKREKALPVLAWIVELVPDGERARPVRDLVHRFALDPPRERRRPSVRYDSGRLIRRRPS